MEEKKNSDTLHEKTNIGAIFYAVKVCYLIAELVWRVWYNIAVGVDYSNHTLGKMSMLVMSLMAGIHGSQSIHFQLNTCHLICYGSSKCCSAVCVHEANCRNASFVIWLWDDSRISSGANVRHNNSVL